MDNVDCSGNESKLSECQHQGVGIYDCVEGFEEAGVICTGKCDLFANSIIANDVQISADVTCESGRVHLVGGDAISRGRVEYCYDGSWYSVCASDLDEEGARVICNTLGYYTSFRGK